MQLAGGTKAWTPEQIPERKGLYTGSNLLEAPNPKPRWRRGMVLRWSQAWALQLCLRGHIQRIVPAVRPAWHSPLPKLTGAANMHWTSPSSPLQLEEQDTNSFQSNDSNPKCIVTPRIWETGLCPKTDAEPGPRAEGNSSSKGSRNQLKMKDFLMMVEGGRCRAPQSRHHSTVVHVSPICTSARWKLCFNSFRSHRLLTELIQFHFHFHFQIFIMEEENTEKLLSPTPPRPILQWLWLKGNSRYRMCETFWVEKKDMSSSTQEPFLSDSKRTFSPRGKKRFWWGLTFVYESASFALWYLW